MTPQSLIEGCHKLCVNIRLEGGALKLRGAPDAVKIAAERLRPYKVSLLDYLQSVDNDNRPQLSAVPAMPKESLLRQLESFMLGAVADDPNQEEVCRVNNMAWEFMQSDGMTFEAAIRLAAEIVVNCNVAPCEAAYIDVLALWQRLKVKDSSGKKPTNDPTQEPMTHEDN